MRVLVVLPAAEQGPVRTYAGHACQDGRQRHARNRPAGEGRVGRCWWRRRDRLVRSLDAPRRIRQAGRAGAAVDRGRPSRGRLRLPLERTRPGTCGHRAAGADLPA